MQVGRNKKLLVLYLQPSWGHVFRNICSRVLLYAEIRDKNMFCKTGGWRVGIAVSREIWLWIWDVAGWTLQWLLHSDHCHAWWRTSNNVLVRSCSCNQQEHTMVELLEYIYVSAEYIVHNGQVQKKCRTHNCKIFWRSAKAHKQRETKTQNKNWTTEERNQWNLS